MKTSTVQTPQKAAIRRSKEKSHKVRLKSLSLSLSLISLYHSKIIAKSLNPAFLVASEADPIDTLSSQIPSPQNPSLKVCFRSQFSKICVEIHAISHVRMSRLQSSPKPSFSSPSNASNPTNALESFPTSSIIDGNQGFGGSEVFKMENVDIQVAVDLLLAARFQVMNSPNIDLRSKKPLDCLIKSVIELLDRLPEEQDRFYGLLQAKVWIGLLCVFMWIVSVSIVMDRDARTRTGFPGMPPPT
ncbi:uncharacterized protein LOC131231179 [Magnolia sinica]|uniref:uncharacterized protein LOC131231179 n=1 Tax=Magnolia sinica TaxID=86752 RepID=UPI00265832E7|nr:uncharacterized protein LOC131231179 [Magnolia sinica]XP_058083275.1 uncharacterized protein LOC131231179 [Magnolia sinica]XP_058083276.1 uncharacterized protein LOC131231179 [Magnolia sinica]XP_058083277.1 uncharacterized protein LOC131231179 [Magnolia sinica]